MMLTMEWIGEISDISFKGTAKEEFYMKKYYV